MTIEFAAIAPVKMLRLFPQKYHLALVQELHAHKTYAAHHRAVAAKGEYVILDNGAYESGSSTDLQNLLGWANHIQAAEIVLPDVLREGQRTLMRVCGALDFLLQQPLEHGTKVMIVPQGKHQPEWVWCCLELVKACQQRGFDDFTIGIPKHACNWMAGGLGRIALIEIAKDYGPIHLLGTDDSLRELPYLSTRSVRSIDSAKPIIYALAGHQLKPGGLPPTSDQVHRPDKYFVTVVDDDTATLAKHNVAVVRSALRAKASSGEVA